MAQQKSLVCALLLCINLGSDTDHPLPQITLYEAVMFQRSLCSFDAFL